MTLIAAIHHRQGIVLASDRKMVDLYSKTDYSEKQKIFQLNHSSGVALYGGIPNYRGELIPSEEVAKCLLEYRASSEDFTEALKTLQETLNEVLKPILDKKFQRYRNQFMTEKYPGIREINNISVVLSNDGFMKYLFEYTTDSGKKEILEKPIETIDVFGLSFQADKCEEVQIGSFSLPGSYLKVDTVKNHEVFTGVYFKGEKHAKALAKAVVYPNSPSNPRVDYCRSLFTAHDKSFWSLHRDLDDYSPMLSNLISAVSKTEELYPPETGFSTVGEKTISAKISDKGFEWVEAFSS